MFKVKSNIGNFERCRKLLEVYQKQGKDISMREIHSFIGWADRNTLRLSNNFAPFQILM